MNRNQLTNAATEDLIQAATEDIIAANVMDPKYDYRAMRYLAAIAKLLLAQARDAAASRGPNPELAQHLVQAHCTRCGHILPNCNCGPPGLCTVCARPRPCLCDNK